MAHTKPKPRNVADQQDALTVYLQDLLNETAPSVDDNNALDTASAGVVPAAGPPGEAARVAPTPPVAPDRAVETHSGQPHTAPYLTPSLDSKPHDAPVHSMPALPPLKPVLFPQAFLTGGTQPAADESVAERAGEPLMDSVMEPAAPQAAPVIPAWAQSRFQCLMFSVAGYSIAAPLEKLNGIIEWPDHITALPGHADWFLGLYRNRGQNVQVIDLATILSADDDALKSAPTDIVPVRQRARYIMLVDDGRMGFASDTVANMLTLEPQGVKWRTDANQRAMVIGTVVDKMCSIIDVDELIAHINQR